MSEVVFQGVIAPDEFEPLRVTFSSSYRPYKSTECSHYIE